MSVSYDPAANSTADPPVLLTASALAAPHLGENANSPYDPYGDWQLAQFGADAGLPIAEPGADPDGDGLSNLEEFVLGGIPLQASSAPSPTTPESPAPFAYGFTPAIENGATIEVQSSTDLSPWSTLATRAATGGDWIFDPLEVDIAVDSTTGAVVVTMSAGSVRRFARLRISL